MSSCPGGGSYGNGDQANGVMPVGGHVHNPLVNVQHLGNPGRREGGGCKAERGVAPERTSKGREDASPKRQRGKRPLSTDQGMYSGRFHARSRRCRSIRYGRRGQWAVNCFSGK